jgi:hypothetical protein
MTTQLNLKSDWIAERMASRNEALLAAHKPRKGDK